MDRKKIKKRAFNDLKRQYFKAVLICFLFTVVFGNGYTFVTKIFPNETPKEIVTTVEKDKNNLKNKSRDEIREDVKVKIEKQETSKQEKYTRGVLAVFANQVSSSKSVIVGILKAFNQLLFKGNISLFFILLLGLFLDIIALLFIKNILAVGKCRFFIEGTKYKTVHIDKLLFIYRVKRTISVAKSMMLTSLYQFLWDLTIIGGVIKHYSYLLVPYIIAENPNISGKDAINLSRKMMDGYKLEAFKLELSLIPWYIIGTISFQFSDLLFLTTYYQEVLAEFYMKVRDNRLEEDESLKELLNDRYLDGKLSTGSYPRDKFTIPEVLHRKWLKLDYKRDYSLVNIILFFFTFAMIGWLWEVALSLFSTGNFVNRGTLRGPWLPIYGYGGVLILILLKPFREKPYLLFILTCLLCGIIEYLTSWYLEVTYNLRWWDYTGYFININGRVCLEGILVFGLGGCGFTYLVAPFLDNLYNKIKPSIKYLVAIILLFFFILDNIYCHNNPNMGEGITSYKNDCNFKLKIL